MSINSNSIIFWIKELSARPFVERVGDSKSSDDEIYRELWTYIPETNSYRIPPFSYGPYRRHVPTRVSRTLKYLHYIQERNIKK